MVYSTRIGLSHYCWTKEGTLSGEYAVSIPIPDNTGYITEGQFYLRNGRIEPFGSLSRLKQQVNARTRDDHRTIMNTMIQLHAGSKESQEKQSTGFRMSTWDEKLLKYGALFEAQMMDLSVNIPLEGALDLGRRILGTCFTPQETGILTSLVERFWPTATRPMAKLKKTKNELKAQREALRAGAAMRERTTQEERLFRRFRPWVKLLSSLRDLGAYVHVEAIDLKSADVAGVTVPVLLAVRRTKPDIPGQLCRPPRRPCRRGPSWIHLLDVQRRRPDRRGDVACRVGR